MPERLKLEFKPEPIRIDDIEAMAVRMPDGLGLFVPEESQREKLKSAIIRSTRVKAGGWKIKPKRWKNPMGEDWYGVMLWKKLN